MSRSAERACRRALAFRADIGLGLIEVLVALTVFAILATSAAALLQRALRISGSNEARVVAANLATRAIETARGVDARTLVDGTSNSTVTVEGRTYTITQTVVPDSVGGTGNSCEGRTGPIAFKRVNVQVSWPGMGDVRPVRSDTVTTLPITGADANRGVLAVPVTGAADQPVAGIPVSLAPAGRTATTDTDGCAVFLDLPPGTDYVATADSPGYVDPLGDPRATVGPFAVLGGQANKSQALLYDRAASLSLRADRSTFSDYPTVWEQGLDVGYTLTNSAIATRTYLRCPTAGAAAAPLCASGTATGEPVTVGSLFPVSAGYSAWAGTCTSARPSAPASGAPAPGGSVTLNVRLYAVRATAVNTSGSPVAPLPGQSLWAYRMPDGLCAEAVVPLKPRTGTDWGVALPKGGWRFVAAADAARALTAAKTSGRFVSVTLTGDLTTTTNRMRVPQ
jgi:type II secretory pathway pseudopilin PulG